MKAQVLADFITECSFNTGKETKDSNQKSGKSRGQIVEENKDNHAYQCNLHVDGAIRPTQSEWDQGNPKGTQWASCVVYVMV